MTSHILHIVFLVITIFSNRASSQNDCIDTATSEGSITLTNGQMACAPLENGETDVDKGKRFIICKYGVVTPPLDCPDGERFDTATDTCKAPELASCQLGTNSQVPSTPKPIFSGTCTSATCQLPDCFCYGATPTRIPLADAPQFIMLTFDDALNSWLYDTYFRAIMVSNNYNLINPNGCQGKSTMYITHQGTDYNLVKVIWDAKNEIADHTITHNLPAGDKNSDYPGMVAEIQAMRDETFKALQNDILVRSIVGFRAPYLRLASDVMYDVLRDYDFLYDTSMLNAEIYNHKDPLWPFTLDYPVGLCYTPPCPSKPYPGLWEVPLNGWIGDDGQGCAMVDGCTVGTDSKNATEQQWYDFFNKNFAYFYKVKVPFPIFTHGFIFTNYPNSYPALTRWLQDVLKNHTDVWMTTPTEVIRWMQNQQRSTQMKAQKWGC